MNEKFWVYNENIIIKKNINETEINYDYKFRLKKFMI